MFPHDSIKDSVVETLKRADIRTLPVDLNRIAVACACEAVTYEQAESMGLSPDYALDGYTIYSDGIYFVLFDADRPPRRIRWTLAHEIGHIRLDHANKPSPQADREAQYFAEQLLMPLAVIVRMGAETARDIAVLCNVSEDAAENRVRDVARHKAYASQYGYTKYDRAFLQQFGLMEG